MRTVRLVLAMVLAGALVPAAPRSALAAASLPDGFRLESIATGQAAFELSAFAFLPGGGMLTLGRSGTVTFVPEGGPPRTIGRIPDVLVDGDIGAVGLAVSPDVASSGFLYTAYSYSTPDGTFARVSRWTLTSPQAPTAMGAERVILGGIRQDMPVHGLGNVLVTPDGALLVGMGDASTHKFADPRSLRAQDPAQPYGKILRVDPGTGAGLPDNPFFDPDDPSSWRSRVYALGFRNPFRFAIDPASGQLVAGDVGWNRYEEVDRVLAGGNYGWPCFEGPFRPAGHATSAVCTRLFAQAQTVVPPILSYAHDGKGSSVTGGTWYTGTSYPDRYRGAYFFGDYARRSLWSMRLNDRAEVVVPPEENGFGRDIGAPVDIRSGPNGDIHYADIAGGVVHRLRYAPGNRAPVALMDTTTDADRLTVTFDASRSYDVDGDLLSYAWQFGDGATTTGTTASHVYPGPGTYLATLTATDPLGATATTSSTVVPQNHAPKIVLTTPTDKRYAVGEPVTLNATATDEEDGALEVRWQTLLFHCPGGGGCHVHPGETSTGSSYVQPFTDHGEDTYLQIVAGVVDSAGVRVETSYEAHPDLRRLTVIAPVPALINGEQRVSTLVAVGSTNVVALPTESGPYRFVSRSDGGAPEQTLTMPASDVVITAVYETAIDARRRALGPGSFLGGPTGPERDIGAGRLRPFAGGDMYWSATTGAHWVKGSIRSRFNATGGVTRFGFPITDELPSAGGRESRFERATFWWSRATSTHFVGGAIRRLYVERGAAPGYLGFPIRDEVRLVGGYSAGFQRGDIYWSRPAGAHVVRIGDIRTRWLALGGHRGRLGYPRTDRLVTSYGRISRFEGGAIRWLRASDSIRVTFR